MGKRSRTDTAGVKGRTGSGRQQVSGRDKGLCARGAWVGQQNRGGEGEEEGGGEGEERLREEKEKEL
jgi:hypothetical protein